MVPRPNRSLERYPRQLEDGAQILGVDTAGSVVYWDSAREVTLGGDVLPDGDLSDLELRRDLDVDETVSDVIEDIEETVGWDERSDYAERLLGGDEDTTDESTDPADDGTNDET